MSEDKPPYGVRSIPSFTGPPPTVLTLKLPLPPSTNKLYIQSCGKSGQRVLSPEHRAYRETVGWEVLAQTTPEQREALPQRLALHVLVRRAKHRDLDNLLKALQDSLGEALGFDDRRIDWLAVQRHEHADLPECLVRIWQAPEGARVDGREVER